MTPDVLVVGGGVLGLAVARDEVEHVGLDELMRRGRANGMKLEMISEEEAREIEPRLRTAGRALWSPATATVDPGAVVRELAREAERAGWRSGPVSPIAGCRARTPAAPRLTLPRSAPTPVASRPITW